MVEKIPFVIGIKMISPKAVNDLLEKVTESIDYYCNHELLFRDDRYFIRDLIEIQEDLQKILDDDI
jgi:hypothetical protein